MINIITIVNIKHPLRGFYIIHASPVIKIWTRIPSIEPHIIPAKLYKWRTNQSIRGTKVIISITGFTTRIEPITPSTKHMHLIRLIDIPSSFSLSLILKIYFAFNFPTWISSITFLKPYYQQKHN